MLRTSPRRAITATVLVLLTALAAAAPAGAMRNVTKQYSVDVTGLHHVEWTYYSLNYDDVASGECKDYSHGAGSQTLGFSTPRPAKYTLTSVVGKLPKGLPKDFPRMVLSEARAAKTKMSVSRTVEHWKDHLAPGRCFPCDREGGCDGPTPDRPQPPTPVTDCRRHELKDGFVTAYYVQHGADQDDDDQGDAPRLDNVFWLGLAVPLPDTLYRQCYPELHEGLSIKHPQPPEISLGARSRKIKTLRRGGHLTIKTSFSHETWSKDGKEMEGTGCDEPRHSLGYAECATTDVTVEVKRLK